MFNIKKIPFINKFTTKKLNYTFKLLDSYDYSSKIRKTVFNFLNTSSHSELKNFIDSQNIFTFSTPIDITEDFNSLKEKLAYELNEQLLKLAF